MSPRKKTVTVSSRSGRRGSWQEADDTAGGVTPEGGGRTRRVVKGTDLAVPAEQGVAKCDWAWKRGWHLDNKSAETLAYHMKTRGITVILTALGLWVAGLLSDPVTIFMLALAAGTLGWTAEYFKIRNGSRGLSITLGIRWTHKIVMPWLDATPRT